MKIEIDLTIEMDEQEQAALACVLHQGPTNRKLPPKAIGHFWSRYLASAIEEAKARNQAYAAANPEERARIDEEIESGN